MIQIEAVGQNGAVPETFLALPDALYAGQHCWTPRPAENTVRLLDTGDANLIDVEVAVVAPLRTASSASSLRPRCSGMFM